MGTLIESYQNVVWRTEDDMKRLKRIAMWGTAVIYCIIVIGYCIGKTMAGSVDLEFRSWVDVLFRIVVWFVPVMLIGVMIFLFCVKQWKKRSGARWLILVLLIIYGLAAAYLSFLYVFFSAFTVTSDQKMADGNLIVTAPHGLDCYHHYAEPVGIFFRRDISFDEERLADSLSKIYEVNFQNLKLDSGETVYVSDTYPGIEVKILRHGYTESTYLDNNLKFALTSQKLDEHRTIFDEQGVELVPYVFGRTKELPEGYGTYCSVLVTDENQEKAAEAIAKFIQTTLREDLRTDGENCWSKVDGSIFLVIKNEESGEYDSIRNIPFGFEPEHSWVFDENVIAEEILEDINKAFTN